MLILHYSKVSFRISSRDILRKSFRHSSCRMICFFFLFRVSFKVLGIHLGILHKLLCRFPNFFQKYTFMKSFMDCFEISTCFVKFSTKSFLLEFFYGLLPNVRLRFSSKDMHGSLWMDHIDHGSIIQKYV